LTTLTVVAAELVIIAVLVAQRSLFERVRAVGDALAEKGLQAGREEVRHIVGRDPQSLDAHGVARAGYATVFPQAIGNAATFDEPNLQRMATMISTEARAIHHEYEREGQHDIYEGLTFWSPNINIFRDPRWGRGHGDAEAPHAGWRPTNERFRDPKTNRVMRVWEDAGGSRHYVPDDEAL